MGFKCSCCGFNEFYIKGEVNNLDEVSSLYIDKINNIKVLSIENKIKYLKKVRKGNKKAYALLENSYLKYISDLSIEFSGHGVHFLEIMKKGKDAFEKAISIFDYEDYDGFDDFCKKTIRSILMVDILNNHEFIYEYVCKNCGLIMMFKK